MQPSKLHAGRGWETNYITSHGLNKVIDPFLGISVAMVFILEVKLRRSVSQFQASLTKLSALLQVKG